MPQQLEEMHEDDTFLEHLEGLKEHPGWLAYQALIARELEIDRLRLERTMSMEDTQKIRGSIASLRLAQNALQILIDEHKSKLKEVRK